MKGTSMAMRALLFAGLGVVCCAGVVRAVPPDTTVTEPNRKFAFDLPRGHIVDHRLALNGQPTGHFEIRPRGGATWWELYVDAERLDGFPAFYGPLSHPADTLVSYVEANAMEEYCAADGAEGYMRADSIVSLRRYRNIRGHEVFEIFVRVINVSYREVESPEEADAVADSIGTAQYEEVVTHSYTFGPVFAVDLSRPGSRLVVWVRPWCGEGVDAAAAPASRRISQTLRRL